MKQSFGILKTLMFLLLMGLWLIVGGCGGGGGSSTPQTSVAMGDAQVIEGNSGTISLVFTVTLTPAVGRVVTVSYATADGTATTLDSDYVEKSGILEFAANETAKSIEVTVNGDTKFEANETLSLTLTNPSDKVTIDVSVGTGTIWNDDPGLNDTGITNCANGADNTLNCSDAARAAFPEQDADFGRDVSFPDNSDGTKGFSFIKLDSDGSTLDASAMLWSCVQDNVTGLTWEVKQVGGLHDENSTFSWYSSDSTANGGDTGVADGGSCLNSSTSRCDTEKFVEDVNAEQLCGFANWRLPTAAELRSLVDFSRNRTDTPVIDTDYFPRTSGLNYWTAETTSTAVNLSWVVQFDTGVDRGYAKTNSLKVRLVRDAY